MPISQVKRVKGDVNIYSDAKFPSANVCVKGQQNSAVMRE